MNTVILTKKQIWQLATIIQQYEVDSIKLNITSPSGIGPTITAEFGSEKEKIDITDVSNW